MVLAWLKLVALPLVFLAATTSAPAPLAEEGAAWVQPFQKANTKSVDARVKGIDYAVRDAHASPFSPATTIGFAIEPARANASVRAPRHTRTDAPRAFHPARAPPPLS
jgi:hypothetical protein